jgi:hypothetical protein
LVTGFCGIDRRTNPVWYRIRKGSNDSVSFFDDILETITDEFLVGGNILVLDNAPIHTGRDIEELAEWL